MTTTNGTFNGIQEYAADQGLKLDWIDQHGEWGVKASSDGKKGLTLSDVQVGSYGDPASQTDNMTGRSRGAASRPKRLPHRRLSDPQQVRHLARQRRNALRRGAPATVELSHRHPLAHGQAAPRRRRARTVPACHLPHGSGVRRRGTFPDAGSPTRPPTTSSPACS